MASESVTHHTRSGKETRWPGHACRGNHLEPDGENWHCFTLSRHHRNTGKQDMEKAPVCCIPRLTS